MRTFIGKTFSEVYKSALKALLESPDYITQPRGHKIHEIMDAALLIQDPTQNIFTNSYRGIPMKYLKKEISLYLAGRRDAEGFVQASKFWDSIKTQDNLINSAYGYLIFKAPISDGRSQFDWVVDSLIKDKDSRQAIMFFNRPEFQYEGNKDFVCTFNMVFHIRENQLFAITSMRSQDIRRGTQFDVPFFTLVQYLVYLKLKPYYPELTLGSYTHRCSSLHIYENLIPGEMSDLELAKNMLDAEWGDLSMPFPTTTEVILSDTIKEISNKVGEYSIDRFGNKKPFELHHVNGDNLVFYDWLVH